MAEELVGNCLIGQSGGPTAVINASVAGVVAEALNHASIEEIYGSLNGVLGLLGEDFVDLAAESQQAIRGLRYTPGAALGTCRSKLKQAAEFERVLEVFKAHNIRYYFHIGDGDSQETASKIAELAQADLKIGVIASSTGVTAVVGMPQKNTVALLPAEIGGQKVEYIVLDDASDPTNAVTNVKKLLSEHKVDALIGPTTTPAALAMLDVDALGLDLMDRKLLEAVIHRFDGGPVGLDNVAAAIGEEAGTIEDVIEPYLIQQGFLQRTPRGRIATLAAYRHLGVTPPKNQAAAADLFGEGELAHVALASVERLLGIKLTDKK